MTRQTQRRRIVVATVVSGALLLVGPAAYGVATAADSVDNPAAAASQDPGGDEGDGQSGEDTSQSGEGQSGEGQDGEGQDGENAAQEEGAGQASGQDDGGGGNEMGNRDGSQGEDKDKKDGLDVLASDCAGSQLQPHDGFQNGNRCVTTAFGEVGTAGQQPVAADHQRRRSRSRRTRASR